MLEIWKKALLSPSESFKTGKENANLTTALKFAAFAGLISGAISGIASLNPLIFIMSLILTVMASVIGILVTSGLYYIFARMLGGKGDYTTQTYLMSTFTAPISILTSVIALALSSLSLTGSLIYALISIPIVLAIAIYSAYLYVVCFKEVHGFSTGRAIVVWLLPAFVLMVLVVGGVLAYYGIFAPSSFMETSRITQPIG